MPRQSHISRVVVGDKWRLPDDAETEDIEGQEGYKFTRLLLIPRSLRDCVQSVEATGIRVKHRLQFMIQLLNPDGHVSEVSRSPYSTFPSSKDQHYSFEQLFPYIFSYRQTCH